MKITIGLLAWNEGARIERTLQSLFAQSLFSRLKELSGTVDVICVPNGSTDDTAEVAEGFFSLPQVSSLSPIVRCSVRAISQPGKANAWNVLVHEMADQHTDFFFILDADIDIHAPDTLVHMLLLLLREDQAIVATDQPLKHLLFKENRSLLDRLQAGIGQFTKTAQGQLCGQLYAIVGSFVRKVWMPTHLVIEDGFLKDMVVSDCLTKPPDACSIRLAPGASHTFTSYTSLKEIFRHQVRQAVGQAMNYHVLCWLRAKVLETPGIDIGRLIRDQNLSDSEWLHQLMKNYADMHWWVLYPRAFSVRFRRLANLPFRRALLLFPVALAGFLFDLPVLFTAHRRLHRTQANQDLWSKGNIHK